MNLRASQSTFSISPTLGVQWHPAGDFPETSVPLEHCQNMSNFSPNVFARATIDILGTKKLNKTTYGKRNVSPKSAACSQLMNLRNNREIFCKLIGHFLSSLLKRTQFLKASGKTLHWGNEISIRVVKSHWAFGDNLNKNNRFSCFFIDFRDFISLDCRNGPLSCYGKKT